VAPALVEGYVSAASKLSRQALGHETAPGRKIYYAREDYSQEEQVDGLPFGTRGGMLVHHYFPADGEYVISWVPVRNTVGTLYGGDAENEQVELTVDGGRIKLYSIGKDIPLTANVQADKNEVRVSVKGGQHAVGVAFIANTYIPHVFLNRSYRRSILDDNPIDGIMQTPQVSRITIQGPVNGLPAQDTPSRKKILICSPTTPREEPACAKTILSTLAGQGKLRDPKVLEQQVRRMLADPRSQELVKNFAGQWLGLRTLQSQTPEGTVYPDFDDNLRQAMRTEAEMFFESILREDRSVSELLTADYTFVNERLAADHG